MTKKRITFSPVTRLSGLLSITAVVDRGRVTEARARSTMFRGFEWIMRDRKITDAVYLTQRVCGICSLAHGAVGSYLLDELYNNTISENAQYLRNIMYAADFLQNHIRHFYLFSLPDFVKMPEKPPFLNQNLQDIRLNPRDNQRLVEHYIPAVKAAQQSHQLLTIFGGKAPHQHSFVHGGVATAPTADKINQALALIDDIHSFVGGCMIPDTRLIARAYDDYYRIGITSGRLISFGLFPFGPGNNDWLWPPGILFDNVLESPQVELISESVVNSYFRPEEDKDGPGSYSIFNGGVEPAPDKSGGYSWVKTVQYAGRHFECGPLARALIRGVYRGNTSTMDRIVSRSLETLELTELVRKWLHRLIPAPPPLKQNEAPVKEKAVAVTDAMRGALLHSTVIAGERVLKYNIITPTAWNFSPADETGSPGPAEEALIGTEFTRSVELPTVMGRIIRSFDPCLSCATHVLDAAGKAVQEIRF